MRASPGVDSKRTADCRLLLKCLADPHAERVADFPDPVVNPEVDMVFFCQSETEAAAAGRQQISPGDVRELLIDGTKSAEGDGAEPPEEFLDGIFRRYSACVANILRSW